MLVAFPELPWHFRKSERIFILEMKHIQKCQGINQLKETFPNKFDRFLIQENYIDLSIILALVTVLTLIAKFFNYKLL